MLFPVSSSRLLHVLVSMDWMSTNLSRSIEGPEPNGYGMGILRAVHHDAGSSCPLLHPWEPVPVEKHWAPPRTKTSIGTKWPWRLWNHLERKSLRSVSMSSLSLSLGKLSWITTKMPKQFVKASTPGRGTTTILHATTNQDFDTTSSIGKDCHELQVWERFSWTNQS